MTDNSLWEPVIGLEIHVELNTHSKLFSTAANQFGCEPNTNITPVCTGQPGALPVINEAAIKKAIQFGCAVQGKVAEFSRFDRKSYFYPDSPRNFQITQFEYPIVIGGTVTTSVGEEEKTFTIHHAHLEDDAGMLKHFSSFAGVDYNRAGVPLIEIVSNPCMHSAEDAVAYAMALKAILEYIDISDCNMEEGSLRFDANISVRPKGSDELRTKTEIKNMNSFNNLFLAINLEVQRQINAYEDNPNKPLKEVIEQTTFRWDPETNSLKAMRKKESADDYRYFPEPDLLPITLLPSTIEAIRKELPELPYTRKKRYIKTLGLSDYHANLLTQEKWLADFFEKGLEYTTNSKALCNWITVEFAGRLKETGKTLLDIGLLPQQIGTLVTLIDTGKITGKIAKQMADILIVSPQKSCEEIIAENPDFTPLSNTEEIEKVIEEVLKEEAKSVEDFKAGREKSFGFLVGQVMKKTRGAASPQLVNELLRSKLTH